jgi:hypothetical protein
MSLIGAVPADGTLPPLPYRYLNPPPALAKNNQLPFSGRRVLPTAYMRASSWVTFTDDGQAGLSGPRNAFAAASGTSAVDITIKPVQAPAGLPSNLAADGNAYSITATAIPSGKPASAQRKLKVTLRWPHIPTAIYVYRGGKWSQLCFSDQAQLTPSTVSCPATALGTFLAVTPPFGNTVLPQPTPASNTPISFIDRYLPLLAAGAVVIVAAILAYLVARPRRSSNGGT